MLCSTTQEAKQGLPVAINGRSQVMHTSARGLAEAASGTAITTGHLSEAGSIGKPLTAMALLQLAEEGRIHQQAHVTEYLPMFSMRSEFEPVLLRRSVINVN